MRPDIITQAVPHADPDFLRIMESLPDPPSGIFEKVMAILPQLHELFLRKRKAASRSDEPALTRIVDEETALIRDAMTAA